MLERLVGRLRGQEDGIALISVLMAILAIGTIAVVLITVAINQVQQSGDQRREDSVIAGAEAILERYAAKLTLDPLYYLHQVDEGERARECTDSSSAIFNAVKQPGEAWDELCTTWDYENPDTDGDGSPDPNPDWFTHPLLDGATVTDVDDVSVLFEVTPPTDADPIKVRVAGRGGSTVNRRSIEAAIKSTSISEFVRITEKDLHYGRGADIFGKVYSGRDLYFDCCPLGRLHDDGYAERAIVDPPNFLDGAQGYDSTGTYGNIRDIFPEPLDFNNFWDDLELITTVACGGGGLCLDDAGTTAWMIHPYVSGADGKLEIWRSTDTRTDGCVDVEEYWWLYAQDPKGSDDFSDMWTYYGTFDYPENGTIWANAHVVIGNRTFPLGQDIDPDSEIDSVVKGSVTIYAGDSANRKNVVINSDVWYEGQSPANFTNPTNYVFGLIASDEVVLNPNAVGVDRELHVNASLLGQSDKWRVARSCGSTGNRVTNPGSKLTVIGSIATISTGDISTHFHARDYHFDARLRYLRPPFFPLLADSWRYEDWKELPLETWMSS